MALPSGLPTHTTFNDLFTLVLNHVFPGVRDNIFTHVPILAWLQKSGAVRTITGARIQETLLYAANDTVGWIPHPGFGQIDVSPPETHKMALYDFKEIAGSFSVSFMQQAMASGSEAIVKLGAEGVKVLELSLRDEVWKRLWATFTGDGDTGATYYGKISDNAQDSADQIHSIPSLVRELTGGYGTVGNIDADTYTWWKNYSLDGGDWGTAATCKANFTTALLNIEKQGQRPTIAFSGTDAFTDIMGAAQELQRITQPTVGAIGFQEVQFCGIPVIYDSQAPVDSTYLLNHEFVNWNILKGCDFKATDFVRPANQTAHTCLVYWIGQLTTSKRNSLGVIFGTNA